MRTHDILLRWTRLIYLAFAAIEALIGLRVLLKLIAANPNNAFASFVYGLTDRLLWPFLNLTATPSSGDMVLDLPAFIGMFVYMLVSWLVVRLIWVLLGPTPERSGSSLPQDES